MLASSSSLSRAVIAAKSARISSAKAVSTRALHRQASSGCNIALPWKVSPTHRAAASLPHICTASRRAFSSSHIARATLASHPPGERSDLVYYPTSDTLRAVAEEDGDDYDIDLIPLKEAQLQMTERAAEQLQRIAARENNPDAALRILVESGGCHGYQYKMELARGRNPDDYHFSHPTVKPSNILVDAVSMSLLKGSVIDFATELIGSTFRVVDNPQAKGNGCGCGVSWELKL